MERISFTDIRIMFRLAILGIAAGVIPDRVVIALRNALSHAARTLGLRSAGARLDDELCLKINNLVPYIEGDERRDFARKQLKFRASDDALFILKDYLPRGWRPTLRVRGSEHIEAALAAGTGAILWIGRFHASRLAWKKALHQNGILVSHLSTPNHGFSPTLFGIRFLNPVCTRIEDRCLQERVLLHVETPVKALRRLREHLDANQVVSISDVAKADKPIEVPFLGRSRTIAPGAPALSMASGAPILPLFPVRTGPNEFDIIIEHPIKLPQGLKGPGARKALATEYVSRLETYVRNSPESWEEWWCVT